MIEGSCLCGAVRFAVDGRVSPLQYCHCTRCQKATGGPYMAAVAARTEHVRWLAGAELIERCELPVREEPPPYRRDFCRRCGAPVPIVDPERPFAVILAGSLDGRPELTPFRRIFVACNPPWYEIRDELPQFPGRLSPELRLPTRR